MYYIKKNIIIIIFSFVVGLSAGLFHGYGLVKNLMNGHIGLATFIFTPSKNMIDTIIMLNSNDELRRIEGYYSYKESGMMDMEFLYNRFKFEKSEITQKIILLIAQGNSDPEKIHNFYKNCYDISNDSLKRYLQGKINSYELLNDKSN